MGHIKATFKSTGWECMDCIYFVQDNDQWWAVVYKKMKLQSV